MQFGCQSQHTIHQAIPISNPSVTETRSTTLHTFDGTQQAQTYMQAAEYAILPATLAAVQCCSLTVATLTMKH